MEKERASKKQRELLLYVDSFIKGNGYGPSYRETMRALGYKSVSTVAIHIDNLIAKGYLRKRDNSARSLEVVTTQFETPVVKYKAPTPAQEKWIVSAVSDKFDELEQQKKPELLDELYVLIGTLKILKLDGAHIAMKSRLINYLKNNSDTN